MMVHKSTKKIGNMKPLDNGQKLRELIESTSLTQEDARAIINSGQMRPIAVSTWKAYLAAMDSERRRPCPDSVLERAELVLKRYKIQP